MAKRISGYMAIDDHEMCYWKAAEGWLLYIPGCGIGRLTNHTVTENEDGTITVSPSILMTGHKDGQQTQRHGFLERGEWREV